MTKILQQFFISLRRLFCFLKMKKDIYLLIDEARLNVSTCNIAIAMQQSYSNATATMKQQCTTNVTTIDKQPPPPLLVHHAHTDDRWG